MFLLVGGQKYQSLLASRRPKTVVRDVPYYANSKLSKIDDVVTSSKSQNGQPKKTIPDYRDSAQMTMSS